MTTACNLLFSRLRARHVPVIPPRTSSGPVASPQAGDAISSAWRLTTPAGRRRPAATTGRRWRTEPMLDG